MGAGALLLCLLGIAAVSCNGNGQGNAGKPAGKGIAAVMSAKERLAKNGIIEKHLDWASQNLKGRVKTIEQKVYKIADGHGKGERIKM